MKKITFIVILILIKMTIVKAQVHTGVNLKPLFPIATYKEVNSGIGVGLIVGYTTKHDLDISFSAENLWFNSLIDNYKLKSLNVNMKYFILKKSVKPFIGFSSGYYQKSFKLFSDKLITENAIGVIPSIGVLFKTNIISNLFINTELSYCKVYTRNNVNLLNFNIGISYFFRISDTRSAESIGYLD